MAFPLFRASLLCAIAALLLHRPPVAAVGAAEALAARRLVVAAGDTLKVTVYNQQDLSGDYVVSPDGMIRLPLAGGIAVAGLDPSEAEAAVRERLAGVFEYEIPVTVDIAAYRPVFVLGAVANPGQHPYVPGLQVLQAYALAGGTGNPGKPESHIVSFLSIRQKLAQTEVEVRNLLIRQSVLEAGLSGVTKVTLPHELDALAAAPEVQEQLRRQMAVLDSEQEALHSARDLTKRQLEQLDAEIKALLAEERTLVAQARLVQAELNKMQSLKDQGLTTGSRMLALQQMSSNVNADRYRQAAELSRARQEQIQVEQKLADAEQVQRNRYLTEAAEVTRDLATARVQLTAAREQLLALGLATTASLAALADAGQVKFTISRVRNGRLSVMKAGPDAELLPGDILEVSLGPAGGSGTPASGAQVADHGAVPSSIEALPASEPQRCRTVVAHAGYDALPACD